MEKESIIIIDDQSAVRERSRSLLGSLPGIDIIGEAGGGLEASSVTKSYSQTDFDRPFLAPDEWPGATGKIKKNRLYTPEYSSATLMAGTEWLCMQRYKYLRTVTIH